jgi:tRNA-2-methylthio-N6-dimethylallyladenosine synthase
VNAQKDLSLRRNEQWVGKDVEVLIKGPAEERGFVRGHTRGNHVVMVHGDLPTGIHQVTVAQATPNRLYCTPALGGSFAVPASLLPIVRLTSNM